MIDSYVQQLIGNWITSYPEIRAMADLTLVTIGFIFLYNLCYFLVRLIGGDR